MNLFWKQGYTNTSMQDLVEVMQINRGSIYATFGDKHTLFLRVLEYYHHYLEKQMIDVKNKKKDLRNQLNDMFYVFLKVNVIHKTKGCLIVNTSTELAGIDPEIKTIINNYMDQEFNFILELLENGTDELVKNSPLEILSKRLQLALIGIRVSVTFDTDLNEIKDMVEDIIATLPWKIDEE